MKYVVKRGLSNLFFMRPITGFIKRHVDSIIDLDRLSKSYAETEMLMRKKSLNTIAECPRK